MVTTRYGGVSVPPYGEFNLALHVGDDPNAVLENRRRACAAIGSTLRDAVFPAQVHGCRATVVGGGEKGRGSVSLADAIEGADGLVTNEPGVVLVILVGDCTPILLVDLSARVLACVHSGWRGAASGVLDNTIVAMTALGARPERMVAAVGPSVPMHRYQVGDEVVRRMAAVLGPSVRTDRGSERTDRDASEDRLAGVICPDGHGRQLLDLKEAQRQLLLSAGVLPGHIHASHFGTGPPGPFYSARCGEPCGRFGLLARLRG